MKNELINTSSFSIRLGILSEQTRHLNGGSIILTSQINIGRRGDFDDATETLADELYFYITMKCYNE